MFNSLECVEVNELKILIFIITLIVLLSLWGCNSKYDGDYESGGVWPFRYYELTLPNFKLIPNSKVEYKLQKFGGSNKNLHIKLYLTNEKKISFEDQNIQLSFKFSKNKNIIWQPNSMLFHHYERMRVEKRAVAPFDNEWFCHFEWQDPQINSRVVPFDFGKPIQKKQLVCSAIIPNPKASISINVECIKCSINGLSSELKLSSSWK